MKKEPTKEAEMQQLYGRTMYAAENIDFNQMHEKKKKKIENTQWNGGNFVIKNDK